MSARLAQVVETSAQVASTRSRKAKIAALATLLRELAGGDVALAVGYLIGEPRQGRIGVGWATLRGIDAPAAAAPTLTLADVDAALTALAATTGAGSVAARAAALHALFERATAAEGEFVRKLFFGELRQGALEGVMADAIAAAYGLAPALVRRAAMLLGELPETAARAAAGGAPALEAVGLQVLRPVSPMLAATAASIDEALGDGEPMSIEYKLDGARIQLHRSGDRVRIFTRNLNDVTDRLPGVAQMALGLQCSTFILDGEVLGVFDDDTPRAFQDTMSRFSAEANTGFLSAYFFDCLHADGSDLIDRPLGERQAALDRVVGERTVPRVITADLGQARDLLDRALSAGHEGVMAKRVDSVYEAGRRGQTWRKVKPVHTVDLVVLAAEWGHGRRRGWLSNLHLGARNAEGTFTMVGKTFKGLTDELLEWQTAELLARETDRHGIAVFVRPELVVEVALDGVQQSTRYPGGVALRFARVRRYRPDKPAESADELSALVRLLPRRS